MTPEKSKWGAGPWQDEPDRVEFEHAGLPCLMVRGPMGGWCGYAAVPPGHPHHGMDIDAGALNDADISAHGGLTYAGRCRGKICHVAKAGEPDDVWWFGFDCAHYCDFSPALSAILPHRDSMGEVYRDALYVRAEVERLADALAKSGARL